MKKFDAYDGMCFFQGLCFFAPVALLVRTQAGVSQTTFFLLQALISGTILLFEIPTGILGDRIGYKHSLVLSSALILLARVLLMAAYLLRSQALFWLEALVEGISITFASGTADAYVYGVYGKENYLSKSAQAGNAGTAGFLACTLAYGVLFRAFGISGLLAATVAANVLSLGCALALKQESTGFSGSRSQAPGLGQLLRLLRQKQAPVLMILASVFSVTGILVNFFYAEKLAACGGDVAWMSPIILCYSLIQMLAKPILDRLAQYPRGKMLGVTCGAASAALMIFGAVNRTAAVIALMLLLPLLLSLPGFFLGEQENDFIDRFSGGENRAASLSVLNMGVSLVEILALFASAALTVTGSGMCFFAAGAALLGFGIWFVWKK